MSNSSEHNVWRIHLWPRGGATPYGNSGVNQFGFCYQRGIIGIGWKVDPRDGLNPTDVDDYLKLVEDTYEHDPDGLKNATIIADTMKPGDIVWARNADKYAEHNADRYEFTHQPDGRLYLGEVCGDWVYCGAENGNADEEHHAADIVSFRHCKLYAVRPADVCDSFKACENFFAAVNDKFIPRITVQKISNDDVVARVSSSILDGILGEHDM